MDFASVLFCESSLVFRVLSMKWGGVAEGLLYSASLLDGVPLMSCALTPLDPAMCVAVLSAIIDEFASTTPPVQLPFDVKAACGYKGTARASLWLQS